MGSRSQIVVFCLLRKTLDAAVTEFAAPRTLKVNNAIAISISVETHVIYSDGLVCCGTRCTQLIT